MIHLVHLKTIQGRSRTTAIHPFRRDLSDLDLDGWIPFLACRDYILCICRRTCACVWMFFLSLSIWVVCIHVRQIIFSYNLFMDSACFLPPRFFVHTHTHTLSLCFLLQSARWENKSMCIEMIWTLRKTHRPRDQERRVPLRLGKLQWRRTKYFSSWCRRKVKKLIQSSRCWHDDVRMSPKICLLSVSIIWCALRQWCWLSPIRKSVDRRFERTSYPWNNEVRCVSLSGRIDAGNIAFGQG